MQNGMALISAPVLQDPHQAPHYGSHNSEQQKKAKVVKYLQLPLVWFQGFLTQLDKKEQIVK